MKVDKFLTHTVQMKLNKRVDRTNKYRLYIPHGSDETITMEEMIDALKVLYIPHGSDETKPS